MHADADFLVEVAWEMQSDGRDSMKAVELSPIMASRDTYFLVFWQRKLTGVLLMQRDSIYSPARGVGYEAAKESCNICSHATPAAYTCKERWADNVVNSEKRHSFFFAEVRASNKNVIQL